MERTIKDINNERWGKLWKKQMRIKQSKQWVASTEPLATYICISLLLTTISISTSIYTSQYLYLYKQLLINYPQYTFTLIHHVIRVTHFIKYLEKNRKPITKCLVFVFNILSSTKINYWLFMFISNIYYHLQL